MKHQDKNLYKFEKLIKQILMTLKPDIRHKIEYFELYFKITNKS